MKKCFYASLTEAQQAAQALGITTSVEYVKRYREDPRLPSAPSANYAAEWQSWTQFFGKKEKVFYTSYDEAQQAAQALGIATLTEYQQRYNEDLRLPSSPYATYSADWQSWPTFLGTDKKFYAALIEAQQAAQALGIASRPEYQQRYREDPRLPRKPYATYAADWESWPKFLGTDNKFYATLAEAQLAAEALGITSSAEYQQRYSQDLRLPRVPNVAYAAEWQSWTQFFGKEEKVFYASYAEAQQAAKALGITSSTEYQQRYCEDPYLPSTPRVFYSTYWQSWTQFLGKEEKVFYTSYAEAQQAAQALGIATLTEYQQRYNEDQRLPSSPYATYSADWQSWPTFLGTDNKFYTTLTEAQQAAQALGITSSGEYLKRYREDPRLSSFPPAFYSADWQSWIQFFDKEEKVFYASYAEALQAAQTLGITSSTEYQQRYCEDPRLPSCPPVFYSADWQSWPTFLGKQNKFYSSLAEAQLAAKALSITTQADYQQRYRDDQRLPSKPSATYSADWQSWPTFLCKENKFYASLAEAQLAAKAIGITTQADYQQRYRDDPRLPSSPNATYSTDWQTWPTFLGTENKFYASLAEAQLAAQTLGITSQPEYQQRYREDPRLPSTPNTNYSADWQSWPTFLGKEEKIFYVSLTEAQQAAQNLGITSAGEYQQSYREDPRLPSAPPVFYPDDWQSWSEFLLPKQIKTLNELKNACKVLGIKNALQYRHVQKNYTQMPSKPDKKFTDWIDWYDLLDIAKPYELHELKKIVQLNLCTSLADYKNLRSKLNDPKMPVSPIEYYEGDGWTNTFDFFGVKRPYQVRYFEPEWKPWGDLITEFLKTAKGGDTKVKDLCEFVREYIEPNMFETSPLDYLTHGKTNIQPMLELFESVPITRKKKWLFSINEFLDWIIVKFLTIEDYDTGEVSCIKGAKTHFITSILMGNKYRLHLMKPTN
ncbi:hypothetical protein L5M37_18445 [Shewanella sp. SM69]|nr:VPA1269 family protein [Shewanella sp. SM69]MCU8040431.1 hypothetical protein [Shewanella sp. SM69]